MQLIVSYTAGGRELRRLVNGLLLSGAATQVKKINYVASYTLDSHKKVVKNQEKILLLTYEKEQENKLKAMLKKSEITTWTAVT